MKAATVEPGLLVHRTSITVKSEARRNAVDVKPEVESAIRDAGVQHGMVLVNCLHTTCSVVITDSDIEDFVGLMARLIQDEGAYRHNDLRWSDCERGNAAAHLRASLLGHGVAIGITDGALALDDEQAILLAEWDGPRCRTVNIHILGA
jgi:secondary thiamine-phosphate synthase enzyme